VISKQWSVFSGVLRHKVQATSAGFCCGGFQPVTSVSISVLVSIQSRRILDLLDQHRVLLLEIIWYYPIPDFRPLWQSELL